MGQRWRRDKEGEGVAEEENGPPCHTGVLWVCWFFF